MNVRTYHVANTASRLASPPCEQSLDVQSYALAALTATGGIIGFARTGSVPSVVAGLAVGVLCMYRPFASCVLRPASCVSTTTTTQHPLT